MKLKKVKLGDEIQTSKGEGVLVKDRNGYALEILIQPLAPLAHNGTFRIQIDVEEEGYTIISLEDYIDERDKFYKDKFAGRKTFIDWISDAKKNDKWIGASAPSKNVGDMDKFILDFSDNMHLGHFDTKRIVEENSNFTKEETIRNKMDECIEGMDIEGLNRTLKKLEELEDYKECAKIKKELDKRI